MGSLFASFEFRRWALACSLTLLVLSLQVVQAARATQGVSERPDPDPSSRAVVAALLVPVEGTVVAAGEGLLGVHETGAAFPVSFMMGTGAFLTRDAQTATRADLRAGDRVRMTVDGRTGQIIELRASGQNGGWVDRLDTLGPLAAIAWIVAAVVLTARWRRAGQTARRSLRVRPSGTWLGIVLARFGHGTSLPVRHHDRACRA